MAGKAEKPDEACVRRRHVFYIPGFDPYHPRRYRELYRTESQLQAKISGYLIEQEGKTGGGSYSWKVRSTIDGQEAETEIEALVWNDIVREGMANDIPRTYLAMMRTAWIYLRSGTLFRLMQLRKGPIIAALYPILMLVLQLAAALLIAALVGWLIFRGMSTLGLGLLSARVFSIAFFCGSALLTLRWFKSIDKRTYAYYLMHDYAFSAQHEGAYPQALEERIKEFAERIGKGLTSDLDEVLVVGHSSGAFLAVSVLADLIREGRVPANGPILSLLTLGQVVPMVSFLPKADRLRADLHFLSARDELFWADVSAPGDGCAFALCDPVSVTGVEPDGKRWPKVFSAAFTQTLKPETWKALRWRFFRLHFQYLCAFDQPGYYDYFLITAGPTTLAGRFGDRPPSKSRIETAVSGYTSIAA